MRAPVEEPRFLVGREAEMETVRSLLADARVVTVTGAGGSGKTRLMVVAALYQLCGQPSSLKVHQRSQPLGLPTAVYGASPLSGKSYRLPFRGNLAGNVCVRSPRNGPKTQISPRELRARRPLLPEQVGWSERFRRDRRQGCCS